MINTFRVVFAPAVIVGSNRMRVNSGDVHFFSKLMVVL